MPLLPPAMAGFKAYGTAVARIQDANKTIFRAALGSIGNDKATFYVWVWSERPDGSAEVIPIDNPPKNAPSFDASSGLLILSGVLDGATVECEVPGFVAPGQPPDLATILTAIIARLADPSSKIAQAIGSAALAAVRAALGK